MSSTKIVDINKHLLLLLTLPTLIYAIETPVNTPAFTAIQIQQKPRKFTQDPKSVKKQLTTQGACAVKFCLKCVGNPYTCARCTENYYTDATTDQCNSCPKHCSSCKNNLGCTACSPKYFLLGSGDQSTCKICPKTKGCSQCLDQVGCFKCKQGYKTIQSASSTGVECRFEVLGLTVPQWMLIGLVVFVALFFILFYFWNKYFNKIDKRRGERVVGKRYSKSKQKWVSTTTFRRIREQTKLLEKEGGNTNTTAKIGTLGTPMMVVTEVESCEEESRPTKVSKVSSKKSRFGLGLGRRGKVTEGSLNPDMGSGVGSGYSRPSGYRDSSSLTNGNEREARG